MEYISKISREDTLRIEDLLNDFQKYWNRKDSGKMASLFTENAEFTDIMGQIAQGKKAIETMHNRVFQLVMKHAVMSHEILYIREVASLHIMITCKWETKGHTNRQNERLPHRQGIMLVAVSSIGKNPLISLVQNFDFTAMYNNVDRYKMK